MGNKSRDRKIYLRNFIYVVFNELYNYIKV